MRVVSETLKLCEKELKGQIKMQLVDNIQKINELYYNKVK